MTNTNDWPERPKALRKWVPKRITYEWLMKCHLRPCHEEVEAFKKLFPRGLALTKANVVKAAKAGVDIEWFLRRAMKPGDCRGLRRFHVLDSNGRLLTYHNCCLDAELNAIWGRRRRRNFK